MQRSFLVLFVFVFVFVPSSQDAFADFSQRIMDLGLKILTKADVQTLLKCCEVSIYNQSTLDQLSARGKTCVTNFCASSSLKCATLYGAIGDNDKCLKPESMTTMKLIDKMSPYSKPTFQKYWDNVTSIVKSGKSKNLNQQQVLLNVYAYGVQVLTKAFCDNICIQNWKSHMTALEVQCTKQNLPKGMNTTGYKCFN